MRKIDEIICLDYKISDKKRQHTHFQQILTNDSKTVLSYLKLIVKQNACILPWSTNIGRKKNWREDFFHWTNLVQIIQFQYSTKLSESFDFNICGNYDLYLVDCFVNENRYHCGYCFVPFHCLNNLLPYQRIYPMVPCISVVRMMM